MLQSILSWYDGNLDRGDLYDSKLHTLQSQFNVPARPTVYTQYKDMFDGMSMSHFTNAGKPSHHYQSLPTDVHLDANGKATLLSYINGLDFDKNADLYTALQELITNFVPLWNSCLTMLEDRNLRNSFHGPDSNNDFKPEIPDSSVFFDPSTVEEFKIRHNNCLPLEARMEKKAKTSSFLEAFQDWESKTNENNNEEEEKWEKAWYKLRTFNPPEITSFTKLKKVENKIHL